MAFAILAQISTEPIEQLGSVAPETVTYAIFAGAGLLLLAGIGITIRNSIRMDGRDKAAAKRIDELTDERDEKHKRVLTLEQELSDQGIQYREQLESVRAEFGAKLKDITEQMGDMREQLETVIEQHAEEKARADDAEGKVVIAESKLADAQTAIKGKDQAIIELTQERDALNKAMEEMTDTVKLQVDKLTKQLQALEQRLAALEAAEQQRTSELPAVKAEKPPPKPSDEPPLIDAVAKTPLPKSNDDEVPTATD